MAKEKIEYAEFLEIEKKLEIKFGQVVKAERIPKSNKMLKLTVLFGVEESDEKISVTNLGSQFEPSDFEGLTLPFITNLKPHKMMCVVSEVMIMVSTIEGLVELDNYSLGSQLL